MNEVTINKLIAGAMAFGQLLIGGLLLILGRSDPELRGWGYGLVIGAVGTGTAARMRTRHAATPPTGIAPMLVLLVSGLLVSTSACAALTGLVKKVSPAERDRAITQLVAYDFGVQEEQLALACEDAKAGLTGYRNERDALLKGIEAVYAGKCSARATGLLDALATAAQIAATITFGGPAGEFAHVLVAAIADGVTSDDCDAFARLHLEVELTDEQADTGLEDLCSSEETALPPVKVVADGDQCADEPAEDADGERDTSGSRDRERHVGARHERREAERRHAEHARDEDGRYGDDPEDLESAPVPDGPLLAARADLDRDAYLAGNAGGVRQLGFHVSLISPRKTVRGPVREHPSHGLHSTARGSSVTLRDRSEEQV